MEFILGIFLGIILTIIFILSPYVLNRKGFNLIQKSQEIVDRVVPVKLEVFYPRSKEDEIKEKMVSNLKSKGQDEIPMEDIEAQMDEVAMFDN